MPKNAGFGPVTRDIENPAIWLNDLHPASVRPVFLVNQ